MTAVYDTDLRAEQTRRNIRTGLELQLHSMASEAANLRELLMSPAHRDILLENWHAIEETKDQLRAILNVLGRSQ